MKTETIHVTSTRQGVWGHNTDHCDASGCAAGADRFYPSIEPQTVTTGYVYEIGPNGVLAEIES